MYWRREDGTTALLEVATGAEGIVGELRASPGTSRQFWYLAAVASRNQPNGNDHTLDASEPHATSHQLLFNRSVHSQGRKVCSHQKTLRAVFLVCCCGTALVGWIGAIGDRDLQSICNRRTRVLDARNSGLLARASFSCQDKKTLHLGSNQYFHTRLGKREENSILTEYNMLPDTQNGVCWQDCLGTKSFVLEAAGARSNSACLSRQKESRLTRVWAGYGERWCALRESMATAWTSAIETRIQTQGQLPT